MVDRSFSSSSSFLLTFSLDPLFPSSSTCNSQLIFPFSHLFVAFFSSFSPTLLSHPFYHPSPPSFVISPLLPLLSLTSQFEITVEEEEYSILTHPVMKELMQQKWRSFVRVHFYLDLILYVIFLLTWTLLYAYPSVQEKYQYIFPRDVWRIIVEVFSAMMSCLFLSMWRIRRMR